MCKESEGQGACQLAPPLHKTLKELREKDGKRGRAVGLNVKYGRNIAVVEESFVL